MQVTHASSTVEVCEESSRNQREDVPFFVEALILRFRLWHPVHSG